MAKQVPNELITTKEQSTDNQFLQIEPLIRTIRGQQVLLDSDLAILYGVETKRLNQQVKRNIERFPEDFMFQLTQEEVICSRSSNELKFIAFVSGNSGRKAFFHSSPSGAPIMLIAP